MLVRTVLKRYFEEHVTYVMSDYGRVFLCRAKRINEYFGNKQIQAITPAVCRNYMLKRRAQGVQNGTIRGEISVLRAAAGWGLRSRWLKAEHMPVVCLPPTSPPRNIRATRAQGVQLIDEAFKVSWRCGLFVVICMFTGCRPSRARYLEWEAVDLNKQIIDFTLRAPQSARKRYTRVRIMPELLPYLQRAAQVRGRGPYVLGTTTDLDVQLARAAKAAGFPRGMITPNSMRHIWATWSAEDGVDLFQIAHVLGNTMQTVESKYAHYNPDYQREATQRRFFRPEEMDAEKLGLA